MESVEVGRFDVHGGRMKLLDYGELKEGREGEGHNGGAVAGRKCDVGFYHSAAKGVSACCGSGLVLIRLAVGFLLPFTFERCADLPHSLVLRVFAVFTGCGSREWLQGAGSDIKPWTSLRMAAINCSRSGARSASAVSISSVSPV